MIKELRAILTQVWLKKIHNWLSWRITSPLPRFKKPQQVKKDSDHSGPEKLEPQGEDGEEVERLDCESEQWDPQDEFGSQTRLSPTSHRSHK